MNYQSLYEAALKDLKEGMQIQAELRAEVVRLRRSVSALDLSNQAKKERLRELKHRVEVAERALEILDYDSRFHEHTKWAQNLAAAELEE